TSLGPMMGDLVERDLADHVLRAAQLARDVPGHVACVQEIKRAVAQQKCDAARVVRLILGLLGGAGACGVRLDGRSLARHGLAASGEDLKENRRRALCLLQPDRTAGVESDRLIPRGGAIGRVFRREVLVLVERRGRAVVVKLVDPDHLRKFGNAAVMIGVVMRTYIVIVRLNPAGFLRLFMRFAFAPSKTGPTAV